MIDGTALTYIGEVNIKVDKKTYSNYNEGKPLLFELFARFLCGHPVNIIDLPCYIDLIDTKIDPSQNQSQLYHRLNITKQYKDEGTKQKLVITSAITDSDLTRTYNNNIDYELLLQDGNNPSNTLASIKIDSGVLDQISTGRQALIEWSLYITNKETK